MDKRFWGFLIVIAIVLGGVFLVSNTRKADAPSASKGVLTNHVEGKGTAKVTLVEYGDFQCPACASYFQSVQQVATKYNDQIVFQFRNFPLYQIHPNAIAGARAAEAADMQGKFWDMHDILYEENVTYINAENQKVTYNTWINSSNPQTYFESYAKKLGLNMTKFVSDYKSATTNDRVQADLAQGTKLGVDSTPTFFLDGKKISNPQPTLADFSKVIDTEIVKKGGTPPAATPATDTTAAPAAQ